MNLVIQDPLSLNSQEKGSDEGLKPKRKIFNTSFNSSDKLRFNEFTQTQQDTVKMTMQDNRMAAEASSAIKKVINNFNSQKQSQQSPKKRAKPITASPAGSNNNDKESLVDAVMSKLQQVLQEKESNNGNN